MGIQEFIIHRLVMKNPSYDAYFSFLIFWVTFSGKMGVATTRDPTSLRPPNPTKTLVHWVDLLGQPLSRNYIQEIFRPEPHIPPFTWRRQINKLPTKLRFNMVQQNSDLSDPDLRDPDLPCIVFPAPIYHDPRFTVQCGEFG